MNNMMYGYPVMDAKELGLDSYFEENPNVAGMAWGGGENGSDPKSPRVLVANPYNPYMKNQEKMAGLLRIEAARHLMNEKGYTPQFEVTNEQQSWRKGLGEYAKNDIAFKQSIISRILSGDEVPGATKKQIDESKRIASMLDKQVTKGAKQSVKDQLKGK